MEEKSRIEDKKIWRWILGAMVIGIFFYEFRDAYKMVTAPGSPSVEAQNEQFIKGLISHNPTLNLTDSVLAKKIATEFFLKFTKQYGREKLFEIDKAYLNGDTTNLNLARTVFDSCVSKYNRELFIPRSKRTCIETLLKKGFKNEQAVAYCNCITEYFVAKYDFSFDHPLSDSIIKSESIPSRNCLKIATSTTSK